MFLLSRMHSMIRYSGLNNYIKFRTYEKIKILTDVYLECGLIDLLL
jgi:hypothetical protein